MNYKKQHTDDTDDTDATELRGFFQEKGWSPFGLESLWAGVPLGWSPCVEG